MTDQYYLSDQDALPVQLEGRWVFTRHDGRALIGRDILGQRVRELIPASAVKVVWGPCPNLFKDSGYHFVTRPPAEQLSAIWYGIR